MREAWRTSPGPPFKLYVSVANQKNFGTVPVRGACTGVAPASRFLIANKLPMPIVSGGGVGLRDAVEAVKWNICANPFIPDSRLGHLPLTAFPQQMDGCRVLHISSHGATAFLAFEAVDGRVWQLRPEYLREVLARSRTQVRTVVSHPAVTRRTLRRCRWQR